MNVDKARQLRDERRAAEQQCVKQSEDKIEKYATDGKSSCMISYKTGWTAVKCFEYLCEQGFECEWTRTGHAFKCKW